MEPNELRLVAKHVMKLLVEERYAELEEASHGVQLDAAEMQDAVEELGRPLVMPAEPAWNKLEVTAVRNWPGAYNVRMDLWTALGKSDLCVELTLHSKNGAPVIEVDGIGPG